MLAPISLAYKFKTATSYAINSYAITSAGDNPGRDPRDWQLQGCGTSCSVGSDSGWTTLDTRTGQWFSNRWQTNTYSFANSTPYSQIRLRITGTASLGGWKATATSAYLSDVPVQAIDGDSSTRWTTGMPQAPGQYFQVDMLAPQTFSQITMDSGSGDYARGYQVFVSNDGLSWGSPIATGAGNQGLTTVTFAQQTARYFARGPDRHFDKLVVHRGVQRRRVAGALGIRVGSERVDEHTIRKRYTGECHRR